MRPPREPVVTTRAVRVERIPDGTPAELPAGTPAQITQALGSSFALLVHGQLMRLKGADADAIGKPVPAAPMVPADIGPDELRGHVWQTLKTCYDPEIPVDIVELGLVYVCDVLPMDDGQFKVSIDHGQWVWVGGRQRRQPRNASGRARARRRGNAGSS